MPTPPHALHASTPPVPARRPWAKLIVCASALVGGLWPAPTRAAEYEQFIDVDTEEDLIELNVNGQISADTFETLVELMRRGIDLNTASRDEIYTLPNMSYEDVDAILRYRKDVGTISDPAQLVIADVLTRDQLASIAAFLLVRDPARPRMSTSGFVRYRTAWAHKDRLVPPMILDSQIHTARHLTVGFAGALTRRRVGDIRWDPVRRALSATPEQVRPQLPKFFAQWDTERWGVIAGTYRIGFGERLTFDNTRNYAPNGFVRDNVIYGRVQDLTRACRRSSGELPDPPCEGDFANTYITPDFRWQETLQGAAIGLKKGKLPVGWMQAYGFFSYQNRDIYQYKIYDREFCADPRNDDDPRCSAPPVYERGEDLTDPQAQISYAILPNMYRELVGGGNVSYFYNRRTHVGLTGYGSSIAFNTEGANLDFQEWDRTPFGGPFGAIGVNGAWGRKWSDLAVELSRSFDSMHTVSEESTGGGYAGVLRHTATWTTDKPGEKGGQHEFETVLRFYDRNFANPFARPLASPDQFEGQRARDEFGGRMRYTTTLNRKTRLQVRFNLWTNSQFQRPQTITYLRAGHEVTKWFTPDLWVDYRNRDLTVNGPGQCYGNFSGQSSSIAGDVDDPDVADGSTGGLLGQVEPDLGCQGQQLTLNAAFKFVPHRKVTVTPRYQHRFVDDISYNNRLNEDLPLGQMPTSVLRQDIQAWLTLNTHPLEGWGVRARVRYRNRGLKLVDYEEQSIWGTLDTSYLIKKTVLLRLRYDLYGWLDQRDSTLERIPRQEHRLLLHLEGRF